MSKTKAVLIEAIQFAPILTLASSFVVTGEINLERAGVLFLISGGLIVIITTFVGVQKGGFNPVLLGTNLWILIGALAFGASIESLIGLIDQLRATGLFACILLMGIILTVGSRDGFVGAQTTNRLNVLMGSLILVALTIFALIWSHVMVKDIRLGGGLPFILLNVSRRVLTRRLSDQK